MTKIKLLTLRETPAYRVSNTPTACNSLELLAAVIGGSQQIETAEGLLSHFDGDIRRIFNAHTDEIVKVKGIGPQTAVRIKAALALGMMFNRPTENTPLSVSSPGEAYALLREMELFEQEHMRVILLNIKMHLIGVQELYIGTVNSAQLRVAEVFRPAIQRNATAIILAHNHPSGDPTPSPDDASTTRVVVQAGKLFDIEVHDHIIIGHGRYVSMRERGIGF